MRLFTRCEKQKNRNTYLVIMSLTNNIRIYRRIIKVALTIHFILTRFDFLSSSHLEKRLKILHL